MTYLLVNHQVKEFNHWKKIYDSHEPARKAHEIEEVLVTHSASDPGDVYILFKSHSQEKADQFFKSADLEMVMRDAGVISRPTVKILSAA